MRVDCEPCGCARIEKNETLSIIFFLSVACVRRHFGNAVWNLCSNLPAHRRRCKSFRYHFFVWTICGLLGSTRQTHSHWFSLLMASEHRARSFSRAHSLATNAMRSTARWNSFNEAIHLAQTFHASENPFCSCLTSYTFSTVFIELNPNLMVANWRSFFFATLQTTTEESTGNQSQMFLSRRYFASWKLNETKREREIERVREKER